MARGGHGAPPTGDPRGRDAVRHAGEGNPVTVSSARVPPARCTSATCWSPSPPTSWPTSALPRRPVRHLHVWDDFHRFRRVPAASTRPCRSTSAALSAVPDPWECPSWAEHFKEPLRTALADLGVEMKEVSQTESSAPGSTGRSCAPPSSGATRSRRSSPGTGRGRRRNRSSQKPRRTRRSAPPASSRGSRSSPTAPPAGGTPSTSPTSPTPSSPTPAGCAATTAASTSTPTPTASWSGRSTGRCDGHSSTSTSSPPGWTMRRPARRSPSATSSWRASSRCPVRPGSATGSWASRACRRCRPRPEGRPPPPTPCGSSRPRSCAGSTSSAAAPDLQHRLRARGGPALRRVGRPGPQGCDQAGRGGARLRAGRRDGDCGDPADAARGGAVPDAGLGRRRDGRVRGADQPGHRPRRARALLGRRPGAAPVPGDALDLGVRA